MACNRCSNNGTPDGGGYYNTVANIFYSASSSTAGSTCSGEIATNVACRAVDAGNCSNSMCVGCPNYVTNGAGVVTCKSAGCAACVVAPEPFSFSVIQKGTRNPLKVAVAEIPSALFSVLILSLSFFLFLRGKSKVPLRTIVRSSFSKSMS